MNSPLAPVGRVAVLTLTAGLFSSDASATTILVLPDGTGDQPTIQAAVNAAVDGDVVLLGGGTFEGPGNCDVDLSGKAITIEGSPSDILCGYPDADARAFVIDRGEGPDTLIRRIRVRRASQPGSSARGGAFYVKDSSPTLEDVEVAICRAQYGSAFYFENAACTLRRVILRDNVLPTTGFGSAIYATNSILDVEDGRIYQNAVDAIYLHDSTARFDFIDFAHHGAVFDDVIKIDGSTVTFDGCFFRQNDQTTITVLSGDVMIQHCTFYRVAEDADAAAIHLLGGTTSISRTLITEGTGSAIVVDGGEIGEIYCSDFWGNAGGDWTTVEEYLDVLGNFSEDPLVCDTFIRRVDLWPWSPCAAGHHPYDFPCGDIGAGGFCESTPVTRESWTGLKSLYR